MDTLIGIIVAVVITVPITYFLLKVKSRKEQMKNRAEKAENSNSSGFVSNSGNNSAATKPSDKK